MAVYTFSFTGGSQSWAVPYDVGSVLIDCSGAGTTGAKGGRAVGTLVVAPGTVLTVNVGGSNGWNGGGAKVFSGENGGGASDVRMGGTALANRIIVGGGAGGHGDWSSGGDGGGTSGVKGKDYDAAPGTQTSGYALGVGGPGRADGWTYGAGGGGGGGYWGGVGGGGGAGSGAGGSGYTGSLISATQTNGYRSGNGVVIITALNIAPLAPTLTAPATNSFVFAVDPLTVAWQHNDSPGDPQTAADVRWKLSGGPTWTTIAAAATTAEQYVFAGALFTALTQIEWQVRTADIGSLWGPWSASSFFNVIATLPAATITTPTPGQSLFLTPADMEWTTAGIPSDAWQVQRTDTAAGTGVVYYDSGQVPSSLTAAQVPLDSIAGRTDYLRISWRYAGHWAPWASVAFDSQFGPPTTPLLVLVQAADPVTGVALPQVDVVLTNPPAGGGFATAVRTDLFRDGVPIATNLPNNSTFTDRLVGAGNVTYLARAYAASGSSADSY